MGLRHTMWLRMGQLETPRNPRRQENPAPLPGHSPTPHPARTPLLLRSPENKRVWHLGSGSNHDTGSQKDLESWGCSLLAMCFEQGTLVSASVSSTVKWGNHGINLMGCGKDSKSAPTKEKAWH